MKDLNEAQKKADEQLAKEKAEVESKETLVKYRETAIAAFAPYLSYLLGEKINEDIVRAGVMELEESINTLKKIKVSLNGEELKSIFDLL